MMHAVADSMWWQYDLICNVVLKMALYYIAVSFVVLT
jgi:hypothetical protein